VGKKLGHLDKYLPHAYKAIGMTVEIFRDDSREPANRYKVTAILQVPGSEIVAETSTINPHSAVDIVEQKLKLQIRKYKDKHSPRRVRIKEMFSRQKPEEPDEE
jgi:ribosomal subunit interface protein